MSSYPYLGKFRKMIITIPYLKKFWTIFVRKKLSEIKIERYRTLRRHRDIGLWFLSNQPETDCIYNLPYDIGTYYMNQNLVCLDVFTVKSWYIYSEIK